MSGSDGPSSSLPVIALAPTRADAVVDEAASESRVLIVDDDPAICVAYEEILRVRGYRVVTAGSRIEALAQIDRLNGLVDVLIMDIALPDADGPEVAREITERIGVRPALYVSGWTEDFWNLTDAPGRWLVMQKPIPVPRLIAAVDWLAGKRTRPPV